MARMIPPVVPTDYPAEGEKEIFRRLRDDPGTTDWIVLHSLGLARHRQRVAGEIDFVAIIPRKGVLCLEVKGCSTAHLRRVDGVWFYGPGDRGDSCGPFRQASEAMHSLRRQLGAMRPDLERTLFASGVVFPYAQFAERSVEWNEWEVIDARALRSAPIALLLTRLMEATHGHLRKAPNAPRIDSDAPSSEQCLAILHELRPDFEVPVAPGARAVALESELWKYTAEQFAALDAMAENPRTIFAGPAGTGKTILAIEAARRARATNRRVLFVCYNRLLGAWLEERSADLRPEVTTGTLHSRMLSTVGLARAPDGAGPSFWETRLPELACDQLMAARGEGEAAHIFDEMVVDEAQDILRDRYLDFLDLSLRGGLAAGRWRMFGDFENQAIHGLTSMPIESLRARRANEVPVYLLRTNCRNTPLLVEWVHLLTALDPPYRKVLRPDDGIRPELHFYRDDSEQRALLLETLERFERFGFQTQDIVVISTRGEETCAAAAVNAAPWKDRLRPLSRGRGGSVGYGSIYAFKGLESPVVIVTDIDTIGTLGARALLYVALTRSVQRIVILARERVRGEALTILKESNFRAASGAVRTDG